jgi:signal transduction histidine kinase
MGFVSPAPAILNEPLQRATPRAHFTLWGVGLGLFAAVHFLSPVETPLWLPSLGVALVLVAWLGYRILPAIGAIVFAIDWFVRPEPGVHLLILAGLFVGQVAASWRIFIDRAKGSVWLHDPLSATLFLIVVAGVVPLMFGVLDALAVTQRSPELGWRDFWLLASVSSLSRTLGILPVVPVLLVNATPILHYLRALDEPRSKPFSIRDWNWGESLELAGLVFANVFLDLVMTRIHVERGFPGWALWGASLLIVVWAAIRQGLRGASLVSGFGVIFALTDAQIWGVSPSIFSPLQGNLLAQASTALMVGASVGWIRDREIRYRHVVGHIPVVLYSVRLARTLPTLDPNIKPAPRQMPKGAHVVAEAEVTLVSPASVKILGADPQSLAGPFAAWLRRVDPADREVILAALSQLCIQREPVTCEYRVLTHLPLSSMDIDLNAVSASAQPEVRWVRDTMVPRRSSDEMLEGWEGILEDVTEARSLSNHLRRMTGMFQALVVNMPAGIFFVSGPTGQPILVNARARELLGQREDPAAGIEQLSSVYRLHRPDGSEYPVDELPVAQALRRGRPGMAKDIVVHRPDGKKTSLVTWAAPVDLGPGQATAAVWVLEDLSQVEKAELARRESEARLRAVFQSMAEGVVILDGKGNVLESNPSAVTMLRLAPTALRQWLAQDEGCIREDGSPFPADEHPDRLALRTGEAVHSVVMGIPEADSDAVRWLLFHCVPLPPNIGPARLVVTLDDITANRRLQEELRQSQRLELIGKIAGGIVHDFNNLLTAIVGTASLMEMGLEPNHPLRSDAARIIEIGEQASHLASQLLTFGRRSNGQASTDLNTAVVHSVRLLRSLLPHPIVVDVKLYPHDVTVPLEDMQVKQIVMNLCLNARDAMPTGGVIRIRTLRDEQQPLPSCLEISDTGIGMAEDVRRRIFEPFFTTKERGTGLGLAAVKQIVESCGGVIQVDSTPGQGTRLTIRFPETTAVRTSP